jgi:hypothetical protein
MKHKEWTQDQRDYMFRVGYTPSTTDEILTMNYCIAWMAAWNKPFEEWRDAGFNNHMYSRIKPKRKQKLLRLNIEKMEVNQ